METAHTSEQRHAAGIATANFSRGKTLAQTRRTAPQRPFKCKICGAVNKNKEEQWEHARTHISAKKLLECNQCRFATQYKHHLQYHTRKHANEKAYMCTLCKYTCVNKYALTSHMKFVVMNQYNN